MKVFIAMFRNGDIISVCNTHNLAMATASEIEEIEEMPHGSILVQSFELHTS